MLKLSLYAPLMLSGLLLAACEGISEESAPPASSKPEASAPTASSTEKPEITTIDRYFSPDLYGPLMRLYHFKKSKTILKITIDNRSKDFPVKAQLVRFAPNESEKTIGYWINNQHSDALYAEEAIPVLDLDVSSSVSILSAEKTGHNEMGRHNDSYYGYDVRFRILDIEASSYKLDGFEDSATVHLRIEL